MGPWAVCVFPDMSLNVVMRLLLALLVFVQPASAVSIERLAEPRPLSGVVVSHGLPKLELPAAPGLALPDLLPSELSLPVTVPGLLPVAAAPAIPTAVLPAAVAAQPTAAQPTAAPQAAVAAALEPVAASVSADLQSLAS